MNKEIAFSSFFSCMNTFVPVIFNGFYLSPNITTSVESFATAQYDENLPPVCSSSDACLASSISYLLFNQATNELFSGKCIYKAV